MHLTNQKTARLAWLIVVPGIVIGLVLALMGVMGAFTGGTDGPASEKISDVDVDQGRAVYLQYCAICHAPDASGIPGLGKDLTRSDFVNSTSDADLRAFVIKGRSIDDAMNTTGVAMPARGGNSLLTDAEIDQIILYLRYRAE